MPKIPEVEYIHNKLYDSKKFARLMAIDLGLKPIPIPTSCPDSEITDLLNKLCSHPVLTPEQELHLFQQFNYYKHLAAKLRKKLLRAYDRKTHNQFKRLIANADATKNIIISYNFRLVIKFIKADGQMFNLAEKISDCNIIVMRTVDKFDWARGLKYSTYLINSLYKSMGRTSFGNVHKLIKGEHKKEVRILTSNEAEKIPERPEFPKFDVLHSLLKQIECESPRNRRLVYILKKHSNGECMREIGERLKITKERIRQLRDEGLAKVRELAKEKYGDLAEEICYS